MSSNRPRAALTSLLVAAAVTTGAFTSAPAQAVSGAPAKNGDHAFTARLDIGNGKRACSAALVDREWLLSAASCFADNPDASPEVPAGAPALKTTATIGRTDLTTTTGQVRNVVQLVPHPDQDLVLARLASPVTGITPVALSATAPAAGEELRVAGYGRTKDEWAPLRLHTGTFSVDSASATQIAITGKDGAAVCKGDTGGPAFREAGGSVQLVGVNSRSWQGGCFGADKAETRTGAIGTRIDTLRTWINANVGPTCASTGALYSVTPKDPPGSLLRRNVGGPGDGTATVPESLTIDGGWDQYPRMLAGPFASFYGIKADGLYFSHRVGSTGVWDIHHRKISTAFGSYRLPENRNKISIDRGGHLWHVDGDGDVRWVQYSSATNSFSPDGNKKIDSGWGRYSHIVATDDGVLYGIDSATGHLLRSRYDFDSQRWLQRHVTVSTANWSDTKHFTSLGGDVLIRVKTSGDVVHYRYHEPTGRFDGSFNQLIGSGSHWALYTNVSGAPDSCALRADYTPQSPATDVDPSSPADVLQAATGEIEYAYTDNKGRIVHGRQSDPADFTTTRWTTGPDTETFSGTPQLAEQPNGAVALTAQNVNSETWWRRHNASSAAWGSWVNLVGAMKGHPVTAKRPDGVLIQFAVDADGKPWYRAQQRPNVDFMSWIKLDGDGFAGPLTAVTVRDGIQLFGTDTNGQLRSATFKDGKVGSWTNLGDQKITHTPSVVVYPGNRLGVFARNAGGKIVTMVQAGEGATFPATWTQAGDLIATGAPSAVINPASGFTEVVARGEDGTIHHTREAVQGSFGTWRAWQQAGTEPSATDPTAFAYTTSAGSTWAYIFRTDSAEARIRQVQPGT